MKVAKIQVKKARNECSSQIKTVTNQHFRHEIDNVTRMRHFRGDKTTYKRQKHNTKSKKSSREHLQTKRGGGRERAVTTRSHYYKHQPQLTIDNFIYRVG